MLCKKHFNQLQAKWYKKLDKSGFSDIEQPVTYKSGAADGNLILWQGGYFTGNYTSEEFKEKEEYYRMAGQFLHEYEFADKNEKAVWELHARGYTVVSILAVLKGVRIHKILGHKVNITNLHSIINRLAGRMLKPGGV